MGTGGDREGRGRLGVNGPRTLLRAAWRNLAILNFEIDLQKVRRSRLVAVANPHGPSDQRRFHFANLVVEGNRHHLLTGGRSRLHHIPQASNRLLQRAHFG